MKRVTCREDHNHAEVVVLIPDEVGEHFHLVDVRMIGSKAWHEYSFAPTTVEEVDDG